MRNLTRSKSLYIPSTVFILETAAEPEVACSCIVFGSVFAASGSPSTCEVRSPFMLFVTARPQAASDLAPKPWGVGLVIRPCE